MMIRSFMLLIGLSLFSSLAGCHYTGGRCDPCTGICYGGCWKPIPGGPLDPCYRSRCSHGYQSCGQNCSPYHTGNITEMPTYEVDYTPFVEMETVPSTSTLQPQKIVTPNETKQSVPPPDSQTPSDTPMPLRFPDDDKPDSPTPPSVLHPSTFREFQPVPRGQDQILNWAPTRR